MEDEEFQSPVPTESIVRFAASLGWRGIEQNDIRLTRETCFSLPVGMVITCWSTRDLKFFIQINQAVSGQFGVYNVSVVAERYGIGPMDFAPCRFSTSEGAVSEARRLAPLFARANFRDKIWRRRYLEQHPQKLLHPNKKWRGWKARLRPESGLTRQ
jgi:hypothetical protein